jgi:hypothetical protein
MINFGRALKWLPGFRRWPRLAPLTFIRAR